MNNKDKRSIIFLFVAMLASSLIIGSYCQTSFAPVSLTKTVDASEQNKLAKNTNKIGKNVKLNKKDKPEN